MPSISLISLLRIAVGLLSVAKNLSRCASCSGVTRERLRFSFPSGSWLLAADRDRLVLVVALLEALTVPIDDVSEV